MNLHELADKIAGELRGDDTINVTGAAGLRDASRNDVAYVSDKKYRDGALESQAACFIVAEFIDDLDRPQIKVADPELSFHGLLEELSPRPAWPEGISDKAFTDPSAKLADGVTVMPFAYVSAGVSIGRGTALAPGVFVGEGSSIGDDCTVYPNVSIMDGVHIGNRVIIHSGTTIGSDGFGFMQRSGKHIKKPHVGGVIIEDDVEIGANSTVDRATFGNTVVGSGTKIDNQVQVAHNVTLGQNTIMAGQSGIAGSSKMGDGVIAAGRVAVKDHVEVAAGIVLAANCGVSKDLKEPGVYAGMPPQKIGDWLKSSAVFTKLPELNKKIRSLEKRLEGLEKEKNRSDEK